MIRQKIIKGASHATNFDEPELLYEYILSDLRLNLKQLSAI